MATLRELVSTVRSRHKLLSADSLLTDRAIASEIKKTTHLLVKRETNLRRLWSTDTLFTTIPCLEMIEVPVSECCEYEDDTTVARSKHKLPRIAEGNYQYVIQGVWSINALGGRGKKLKQISINRYINLLKLDLIKDEEYFWITDGYLYCNNPMVTNLRISAMFEEDVPSHIMYPECDCIKKISSEEICTNPLDKQFSLPGYLEKQVIDLVSTSLLGSYFTVKTDLQSDKVDGQAPNTK